MDGQGSKTTVGNRSTQYRLVVSKVQMNGFQKGEIATSNGFEMQVGERERVTTRVVEYQALS